MPNTSTIPAGYTFLHVPILISVKGKELADKLLKQAADRDPDSHGMYIYNDFYSYAVLNLIDKTLTTAHTRIVKKEWIEAYNILEALVAFAGYEGVWMQCDDGERVEVTYKALGASVVTVLRGLKGVGELDPAQIPSLESFLKNMVEFAEACKDLGVEYAYPCRAIARRLFADKSEADLKVEIDRLNEYANGLEDEGEKESAKEAIKEIAEERAAEAAKGKPLQHWFSEGKVCDEDDNDPEYKITRMWRQYKDFIADCPKVPMKGPPKWDITKWTATEKRQFSFDAMD